MLPAKSAPKGMKEALNKVLDDRKLQILTRTRRRNQFYAIAKEEQWLERKRRTDQWVKNADNSIIETPENKRRNLIKAAWRNVIRKENNEKRNTLQLGNAEVSGNSGAIKTQPRLVCSLPELSQVEGASRVEA